MKATKYEHACWDITEDSTRIVIDPGVYSKSLTDLANISAVVITHVHADHFDPEKITAIKVANPSIQIFGTQQVADEMQNVTVPTTGKQIKVGEVTLEFLGETHHLFHDVQNIAVVIDQKFFSPGDSYTRPNQPVKFAAVPASAPWLRIDEAIQNIKDIPASIVAPTHNALLSEIGEEIHYRILSATAKEANKEWRVLKTGESIEV